MAGVEDVLRSATPGGNIAKPLMLALGALLASGALFRGGGTGQTASPGPFWQAVQTQLRSAAGKQVFLMNRGKTAHASCELSRDFISLPVLKKGTTLWPTETRAPVRGFLPSRAWRRFTKKLPNPRSSTRSPRAIAETISAKIVFTSFSAC